MTPNKHLCRTVDRLGRLAIQSPLTFGFSLVFNCFNCFRLISLFFIVFSMFLVVVGFGCFGGCEWFHCVLCIFFFVVSCCFKSFWLFLDVQHFFELFCLLQFFKIFQVVLSSFWAEVSTLFPAVFSFRLFSHIVRLFF